MYSCVSLAALCRIRGLQAPRGSLDNVVSDIEDGGESIPVPIKLVILQQVTSGMEALVDQKLIHRDLALRNVLVFALDLADAAATSVKVADFGLTVNSYTAGYNYVQGGPKPIRWLAPESLRRGKYSEKSDVWSYAVLAWELLSNGEIPYFGIPSDEGVIQHVIAGNQLARPTEQPCPDPLWSIVTSCWQGKAGERSPHVFPNRHRAWGRDDGRELNADGARDDHQIAVGEHRSKGHRSGEALRRCCRQPRACQGRDRLCQNPAGSHNRPDRPR